MTGQMDQKYDALGELSALRELSPVAQDSNSARLPSQSADAVVLSGAPNGAFTCALGQITLAARPAVSCLVAPQAGDRVLIARLGKDEAFILAVLERQANTPALLTVPQASDVVLSAPHLVIASDQLDAKVTRASLDSEKLSLRGNLATVAMESIDISAQTITSTAGMLMQKAGNVIRRIRGVERVTAASRVENVETALIIRSGDASITAKKNLRLDAEQISAG